MLPLELKDLPPALLALLHFCSSPPPLVESHRPPPMLLRTASFVIAVLLPLALAKKKKAGSNDAVVVLAASPDPSNLSPGSMTTAQGCTRFYDVGSGDICQSVANEFNITLDVFCEPVSAPRASGSRVSVELTRLPVRRRHEPPGGLRVPKPGNLDRFELLCCTE